MDHRRRPYYIKFLGFFYGFNFFIFFVFVMLTFFYSIFSPNFVAGLTFVDYIAQLLILTTVLASLNAVRNFVFDRERSRMWGIISSVAYVILINWLLLNVNFDFGEILAIYRFILVLHVYALIIFFYPKTAAYFVNPPPLYNPEKSD